MLSTEYNRLFTFGCSFTNYYWITWADIIAACLDIESYNFGMPGFNTHGIAFSILQADRKYKFTDKDCIIVEWTNIGRDFDVIKDTDDSIEINTFYSTNRDTFGNTSGDLTHVFSNVQQIYTIEKAFNIISVHMADNLSYLNRVISALYIKNKDKVTRICELYKEILDKPNFLQTVLDDNWGYNKKKYNIADCHPLPEEHFEFCKKVFNVNPDAHMQVSIKKSNDIVTDTLSGKNARQWQLYKMNNNKYLYFPNKWTSIEI